MFKKIKIGLLVLVSLTLSSYIAPKSINQANSPVIHAQKIKNHKHKLVRHGWITKGGYHFYLNQKNGKSFKGFHTIGKAKYYFNTKTGVMKTGWLTLTTNHHKKTYFLKNNGQMLLGQHIIKKNNYLFDYKTGLLKTGYQNLSTTKQTASAFFKSNGQMQWKLLKKGTTFHLYTPNKELKSPQKGVRASVIQHGFTLVGHSPYKWDSGRSKASIKANRFDCSSFIAWMYSLAGHPIYNQKKADTKHLWKTGKSVTFNTMLPGDIIIMRVPNGDNHAMIYLGHGYILHDSPNSTTGGVGINYIYNKRPGYYGSGKTWRQLMLWGQTRYIREVQ